MQTPGAFSETITHCDWRSTEVQSASAAQLMLQ
jgi:hypothetical protein